MLWHKLLWNKLQLQTEPEKKCLFIYFISSKDIETIWNMNSNTENKQDFKKT